MSDHHDTFEAAQPIDAAALQHWMEWHYRRGVSYFSMEGSTPERFVIRAVRDDAKEPAPTHD